MNDLFEAAGKSSHFGQPLAERLRPQKISEVLGQDRVTHKSLPWEKLLASGNIPNLILWGPPGTGKTSFAQILGKSINAAFIAVNAIETGAKTLRDLSNEGRLRRLSEQRRTVLFVDEIHRLNKGQQDVLLPAMESGDLILIGATTENPSYELNSALLSRSRVLIFERLDDATVASLIEKSLGEQNLKTSELLQPETFTRLLEMADGDGRRAINMAEALTMAKLNSGDEMNWPLAPFDFENLISGRWFVHDAKGDQHYDLASAFIKSVRGSDPDAAVYYLARMIKGGDDPRFIARRLVILASKDIGNADPRALPLAIAGFQAVEMVGLPEAGISLAQVVTYLASAPKSNRSYAALNKAYEVVERTGSLPVPMAFRSSKTKLMKDLGAGRDYKYSHESERGFIAQEFLPPQIAGETFYEPSEHGFEKTLKQYLEWLRQEK